MLHSWGSRRGPVCRELRMESEYLSSWVGWCSITSVRTAEQDNQHQVQSQLPV